MTVSNYFAMDVSKESSDAIPHECSVRCGSCSFLTFVLSKDRFSDEEVAAYLKWCCVRYAKAWDSRGRTLAHVAASKGRLKLLTFLLKHRDVDINERDKESHYTALHRSLFYGQIHCAVRLIELGADVHQLDLDYLTPLDHTMMDKPRSEEQILNTSSEVYVWGNNKNNNLGLGHPKSRDNPKLLKMFTNQGISVKQVAMSEFHSLFLASDGVAYTCGHGMGGRLGLGNEMTVLTPMPVRVPASKSKCKRAALGVDHTILLLENNAVFSFGMNTYHQLGHSPPPEKLLSPREIKGLKDVNIIGIGASKFHSVFWSSKQVYTCGLNAGQLGFSEFDSTVDVPKPVTNTNFKISDIATVACSDCATVVGTKEGTIYMLYKYECKKIVFNARSHYAKIICVSGGHRANVDGRRKGDDELKILIVTNVNSVHLWQESFGNTCQCEFSLRRVIKIEDAALNKNFLLLTTSDGEGFQGELRRKKKMPLPLKESFCWTSVSGGCPETGEYVYIKLKKIPHIHRGSFVACDPDGKNFAVTQVHPKLFLRSMPTVHTTDMKEHMKNLFETVGGCDPLHDVVFEVGGARFSCHRYIVAHSSHVLEEKIKNGVFRDGVSVVRIDNMKAHIFRRVLCFIYTQDIDLTLSGLRYISIDSGLDKEGKVPILVSDGLIDSESISAFEYRERYMRRPKPLKPVEEEIMMELLKSAADRFKLLVFQKKLKGLKYLDGTILVSRRKVEAIDSPKFDRNAFQHLWDVTLRSEDGLEIKAHKCILVGRSEFFNCMINRGWLESSQKSAINLTIPGKVLQVLIDYLYTDEAEGMVNSEDVDLISMTLVIADQYFCIRLKEYAEFGLAVIMDLRNAAEVLLLAVIFNADQLKRCAMEFICLNMSAILESRSLEILQDSTLVELKDFYRNWAPDVGRRKIPDYVAESPIDNIVELVSRTEPVSLESVDDSLLPTKVPKKKPREKRNSESGRSRNTSIGSGASETEPEPLSWDDFSDEIRKEEEEAWVKVVKHQKNAQVKAKSLTEATLPDEKPATKIPVKEEKITPLIRSPAKDEKSSPPIRIPPREDKTPLTRIGVKEPEVQRLEKEFQLLSTSLEADFPAINASERSNRQPVSPKQGKVEVFNKFVKLSQKQRKRLGKHSISEDEETPKKPEVAVTKAAWDITSHKSQLLADIMKEEIKNKQNSLCSSPQWQGALDGGSSLTDVMAFERRQRDILARMKSKPLEYTQLEDRAMRDLLMMYNAYNITDERITVRRAEYESLPSPVWVSGKKS